MRLVPTHCSACFRAALAPAEVVGEAAVVCGSCGLRARVLPGQSYALSDASLFKDLEMTLHEAHVTPFDASLLRAEMARGAGTAGGLERLMRLLPSLSVLELIVGEEPFMKRKAEAMLAVLLEALAASRRRSGTIAAVAFPSDGQHGSGRKR
jgi:hypothetical protein